MFVVSCLFCQENRCYAKLWLCYMGIQIYLICVTSNFSWLICPRTVYQGLQFLSSRSSIFAKLLFEGKKSMDKPSKLRSTSNMKNPLLREQIQKREGIEDN